MTPKRKLPNKNTTEDPDRSATTSAQKVKRIWMKESRLTRKDKRRYDDLMIGLRPNDDGIPHCVNHLRIEKECFKKILKYIQNDIRRRDTVLRQAIPTEKKLAVVLRFLAAGEPFQQISIQTQLSNKYISDGVSEVVEAIYKNMQSRYMRFPDSIQQWRDISNKYNEQWQFPHCMGALDGIHINSYEKESIVLLAMADADCKFTFVDIGCSGNNSNEEVLKRSDLTKIIDRSTEFFPSAERLGKHKNVPFVFIAADSFKLQNHLIKRYSYDNMDPTKQVFNLRLNHARQCIERALSILLSSFQILQRTIQLDVRKVIKIVQCCCVLHNFLIDNSQWYRQQFDDIPWQHIGENVSSDQGQRKIEPDSDVRQQFSDYFSNEGSVSWQYNC